MTWKQRNDINNRLHWLVDRSLLLNITSLRPREVVNMLITYHACLDQQMCCACLGAYLFEGLVSSVWLAAYQQLDSIANIVDPRILLLGRRVIGHCPKSMACVCLDLGLKRTCPWWLKRTCPWWDETTHNFDPSWLLCEGLVCTSRNLPSLPRLWAVAVIK